MAKTTPHQRMIRSGQPYTRVVATWRPFVEDEGDPDNGVPPKIGFEDTHIVYGYTLEEQLVPTDDDSDPEYKLGWQEIEVGAAAALADAHALAAEWRLSLVGNYPVR